MSEAEELRAAAEELLAKIPEQQVALEGKLLRGRLIRFECWDKEVLYLNREKLAGVWEYNGQVTVLVGRDSFRLSLVEGGIERVLEKLCGE